MDRARSATAVLLGASNVRMGRRSLVAEALAAARATSGCTVDVLVAAGHGRSYGEWSRVLGRGLPGIVGCGLWEVLGARPDGDAGFAVLTDVGNDLAYGASPELLAGWIETCLVRLRGRGLSVAMSCFPCESVARLGELRFTLLRSLLFPGHRFSRREILRRGDELNRRLEEMAERRGAVCVRVAEDRFGPDAIHLRPSARPVVWRQLVEAATGRAASSRMERLRIGDGRPALRTLFGIEQRAVQPRSILPGLGSLSYF